MERGAGVAMPDCPIPFGYKTSWLCVKSDSPEEVISALGLNKVFYQLAKSRGLIHAFRQTLIIGGSGAYPLRLPHIAIGNILFNNV